ncbi:MAG: hypothetical protein ACKV2T_07290 [Kofleriaceae bacterium]
MSDFLTSIFSSGFFSSNFLFTPSGGGACFTFCGCFGAFGFL